MLEPNILTLSDTSKFTLLKPCDNRIPSHFLMGFFHHCSMILHSCPFSLPFLLQSQPLCTPDKLTLVPGICSHQGTEELRPNLLPEIFHGLCWGWLLQVLFPSWLNLQREELKTHCSKLSGVPQRRGGKWKHYPQQVWLHQSFELCRRNNFISVLPLVLFHLLLWLTNLLLACNLNDLFQKCIAWKLFFSDKIRKILFFLNFTGHMEMGKKILVGSHDSLMRAIRATAFTSLLCGVLSCYVPPP